MPGEAIVIAANFTAEPVKQSLAFWMDRLQLAWDISFAPYDQIFQQLLDPSSAMSRNTSGINVLLLKLDNWSRAADTDPIHADAAVLERNISELVVALKAATGRHATPCFLMICPPAPVVLRDPASARVLEAAQESLVSALRSEPGVRVITATEIMTTYPVDSYYDPASEASGQIPYSEEFFVALGTMLARQVRGLRNAPYKVLALDCDNTLWQGVVGELGPLGVGIDESTRTFHEFLVRQHETGMLLCLCSKNNEADVAEVFQCRTDMPLTWDHIVSSRINWAPKSENLRALASELNLGLDSFIFIDDSPFEVAEVRAQCPEVLALQLPADPVGVRRFIRHCWAFDRGAVTSEDLKRAASYQENRLRDAVFKQAGSLDEFLQNLELNVEISAPAPEDFTRVAQMTQRTSQFNATTIRRNEAEVRRLCDGQLECRIVRVRDRFGDYGVVGLMLFEVQAGAVRVDSFLLSCRALGRRVEHRMLAELGRVAATRDRQSIEIPFIRTAKNFPVLEFFNRLSTIPAAVEGDHTFEVTREGALAAPTLAVSPIQVDASVADDAPRNAAPQGSAADSELMARIFTDLATPSQIREAIAADSSRSRPVSQQSFVAPRTERERQITEIWKHALHLDRIGVRDNFFDLGGTSLAAVPLFARLGKALGTPLSPYLLFQAPTIEQLAALIETSGPRLTGISGARTSLVAIQGDGSRRPLFLVHAGAGSILFYYPLAAALGRDQPVYGLQAQGLDGGGTPHASVTEMAAHYVGEIRSVQPSGPYQLAGFCFGATLAFEMAQQLRQAGEAVSFLGSFDGLAPSFRDDAGRPRPTYQPLVLKRAVLPAWTRMLPAEFARSVLYHVDAVRALPPRGRAAYVVRKSAGFLVRNMQRWRNRAIRTYTAREGGPVPVIFRSFRWYFHVNNLHARMRYSPLPYPGDITVFTIKGRYREPQLGWARWVTRNVSAIEVSGEFRSHRVLLEQPMVSVVAATLSELLASTTAHRT